MNVSRIEDQVVLQIGDKTERIAPEEALLLASDLTSQADQILKALAEKDE